MSFSNKKIDTGNNNEKVKKIMQQINNETNSTVKEEPKKVQPVVEKTTPTVEKIKVKKESNKKHSAFLKKYFDTDDIDLLLKENYLTDESSELKDDKMYYHLPQMSKKTKILLDTQKVPISLILTNEARLRLSIYLKDNRNFLRDLLNPTNDLELVDNDPYKNANIVFQKMKNHTSVSLTKANILRLLQIEKTLLTNNNNFNKSLNLILGNDFKIIK